MAIVAAEGRPWKPIAIFPTTGDAGRKYWKARPSCVVINRKSPGDPCGSDEFYWGMGNRVEGCRQRRVHKGHPATPFHHSLILGDAMVNNQTILCKLIIELLGDPAPNAPYITSLVKPVGFINSAYSMLSISAIMWAAPLHRNKKHMVKVLFLLLWQTTEHLT